MSTNQRSYTQLLEEAVAFIQGHSSFLIVSHVQPDGDAISSCSAMAWLVEQFGKQATIINESELPSRLSYLYHYENILKYEEHLSVQFDAVIALDCADDKRMGEVVKLYPEHVPLLNIDHHATNNMFGTLNIVRATAAATVEIIYDLIKVAQLTPSLSCAKALYTGLLTDTGGFRYSNTSPDVMQMASHLLSIGVSGYELADWLLEKMSIAKVKLLKLALSRISFNEDESIGWITIKKDDLKSCGAVAEDMEGIVNYVLNVDGVEVGILFKEAQDGSYKASLRSAGKVDVAAIAQGFGGGGHVRAAGCSINLPIEECVQLLVGEIGKALT